MYPKPTDINAIIPSKYSLSCDCSGCIAIETIARAASDHTAKAIVEFLDDIAKLNSENWQEYDAKYGYKVSTARIQDGLVAALKAWIEGQKG